MFKSDGVKRLRRAFYKGRATKFKRLIIIMAVVGVIASLGYFARAAYINYAVSGADIVLTYPEIAQSRYPDGRRFTYYDLISDENLGEALEIMQKDGKYKNFTVDDIKNNFYLYSYLEGSAGASVSSARSEGNDFSYVANEYKITFVQPHDYKGLSSGELSFSGFVSDDYSKEFLETLVEVNRVNLAEKAGGINGFKALTAVTGAEKYDYSEKLTVYKTRIDTIIAYLKYLGRENPDFVSGTGMTIKDMQGKYQFLISNSLNGISNFIESSGISKDVEMASNKLKVNIENNTLKYNKHVDRAQINSYAMTNYDQTFTENLINVIQNKEYGLYQARPKTAFDTVVVQKHEADESVAEYGAKITKYNKELDMFGTLEQTPAEKVRLITKCEGLMASFEAEYNRLSEQAAEFVAEYYNGVNENYISAKVTEKGLINSSLIIKMGIVFAFGAALAFIATVVASALADKRKVRRKQKLIKSIKNKSKKEA